MKKMNKRLINAVLAVIFALSLALFVGCGSTGSGGLPVESGKDTVISKVVGATPDKYNAKNAVYAAIGRLSQIDTYKSTSTGTSVASVGGLFGYTQKTDCVSIKHGDEFYTDSNSESRFVTVKQEVFAKGGKIAYRVNGGDIVNTEAESYKEVFGVTPDKLLSGHIFNDETIAYAQFTSVENGEYTFRVVLDKDKGNALLIKQMKEYGNLNDYPVFTENTVIDLTLKEDFTPVKFSYTSKYIVNVSVLGDLPCVESNEVVFSDFNEEVAIPDTEAFNRAVSSEPSTITPSEEKEQDETSEKIVAALLKADLIGGVALNGVVKYNGVELPVKINGRADIDKIMNDENADILSLIDLKVSLGVYSDSLAVTYHDEKLYFDLGDLKFVKELEFEDETEDVFDTIADVDLSSYFAITEEDGDMYTVRINNLLVESMIKTALVNAGLAGDNINDCFDLSVGLYIPTDRVGVISLNLTTDLVDFGVDFNLSDEKFVLPADENYETEPLVLKTGFDVSFNLANNLANFTATGKAYVSYDITEPDPSKALKAELNVTLDNSLKGMIGLSSSFSSDVPAWLGTISEADSVNLVYSDGKLMLIAMKGDKPTFATEIPLGDEDEEETVDESDADTDSDDSSVCFETIKSIIAEYLVVNISGGVISLNVKDEVVNLLGYFWNDLPELLITKLGKTGGMILGGYIAKPLEDIGIDFDIAGKSMTIYIDAYDVSVGGGNVYIEGRDYEITRLFGLTVSAISADDYSFAWNIDKIYEDYLKAEEVIEEAEKIADVSIAKDYTANVNGAKARYEGLSDDQKSLCYNVSGTDYYEGLITESGKLIKAVEDFAGLAESGKISTLNSKYKAFTAEQRDYLSENYSAALETYIGRRVEDETGKVAALKTFIDGMQVHTDKEFDAMTDDEIYQLFNTFAVKYESINALCEKSQKSLDLEKFEGELNGVVETYVKKIGTLAENTKEEVLFSDNLTVEELLVLYNRVYGFERKYSSGFASKKIWSLVKEADPDFEVKCYLPEYYLRYNGSGFRKYAVLAIEKEIDALTELVKGEYDRDELSARMGNVDKLMGCTDKSAISNTDKLDVLKET